MTISQRHEMLFWIIPLEPTKSDIEGANYGFFIFLSEEDMGATGVNALDNRHNSFMCCRHIFLQTKQSP